ncbi:MAG: PEP-CTERM sorting domain-containing protein [Acidobacteria bacterium]|nr:PEP-CTERM sorting domain-containing protein [Acidobacteriota bacterium]
MAWYFNNQNILGITTRTGLGPWTEYPNGPTPAFAVNATLATLVPEPSAVVLLGLGLGLIALGRRRPSCSRSPGRASS